MNSTASGNLICSGCVCEVASMCKVAGHTFSSKERISAALFTSSSLMPTTVTPPATHTSNRQITSYRVLTTRVQQRASSSGVPPHSLLGSSCNLIVADLLAKPGSNKSLKSSLYNSMNEHVTCAHTLYSISFYRNAVTGGVFHSCSCHPVVQPEY